MYVYIYIYIHMYYMYTTNADLLLVYLQQLMMNHRGFHSGTVLGNPWGVDFSKWRWMWQIRHGQVTRGRTGQLIITFRKNCHHFWVFPLDKAMWMSIMHTQTHANTCSIYTHIPVHVQVYVYVDIEHTHRSGMSATVV